MAWTLTPKAHQEYARNTLVSVICQLRFHPILKFADKVPDFQEHVRAEFPVFGHGITQSVSLIQGEGVEVQEAQEFRFQKVDRSSVITLNPSALSVETNTHQSRRFFFPQVSRALAGLDTAYKPVTPFRLGLRYVNVIDRDHISQVLGRPLQWADLVVPSFLHIPEGLADLEETLMYQEVSAKMAQGGMTLRHGLLRDTRKPGAAQYRFDVDRYIEGDIHMEQVPGLLEVFASDVFSAFSTMVGKALSEWMEPITVKPK